ncbi:MAG: hypothetical protein ACOH2O_00510 [Pseudomonas sp.]|jgi:hypothetical protein
MSSNLPNDPTLALLNRLNQNITALGSAVNEIRAWIDQHGSPEVSAAIMTQLAVVEGNAGFIAAAMTDLQARREPEDEIDPED